MFFKNVHLKLPAAVSKPSKEIKEMKTGKIFDLSCYLLVEIPAYLLNTFKASPEVKAYKQLKVIV